MAGGEVARDRRLGGGEHFGHGVFALRGQSRRRDHFGQGPLQVRDAGQAGCGSWLRLGVL